VVREIHLQIDAERCRTCHRCLAAQACKVRAIVRLDPDETPFLDVSRCYDCRLCVLACPFEAIVVVNRFPKSEEAYGGVRH
jgi:Fe-S-cluster-containing hydrogenase component 2